MDSRKNIGAAGEREASRFLQKKGYKIVSNNYRSRFGEIDIIAKDKGTTVFIEVKTRSSSEFGSPADSVNYYKLRKLIKTSQFYISRFNISDYRFDVLEVIFDDFTSKINHIENVTF